MPLSPVLSLCVTLACVPACTDDRAGMNGDAGGETGGDGDGDGGGNGDGDGDGDDDFGVDFDVRESVEQLHVWHTEPGDALELEDPEGQIIASVETDVQGSHIFRGLAPGDGYILRNLTTNEETTPLTVMSWDNSQPGDDFYTGQTLQPGFNYIKTRDGTLLSAYVQLPGPVEDGPYPTLVNYSGYEPSRPGGPLSVGDFDIQSLCPNYPVLCDAPNHPSGIIGGVMGFATVGVNMRGTGCSEGAYDYFEDLQLLDGYDIIETVAAQDWVKDNRVGMAGLSYPGISQIFVASTQPPSLAAITPLSVIADINGTLVPGGILNDGFAISWANRVLSGAGPYGQGWEQDMIDAGDPECAEHQLLHSQAVDIIQKAYDNPYYDPAVADPLNLNLLAPDVNVPVFLSGAWQDEQTGPNFASLLDKFNLSPLTRFSVFNGVHPDGYTPFMLTEWFAFLSFYVANEVPEIPPDIRFLAPFLFESQFGEALELPPDRFADYPDVESARAAFEAEPIGRAIFEVGAAEGESPGLPVPAWETSFDTWPPESQVARRWYLHEDGVLRDDAPTVTNSASQYIHQPEEGQKTNLGSGAGPWDTLPNYDWAPHPVGAAIVFETEPLTEDMVMLGYGSIDLYVRSSTDDADLEVTVSEVRPDGKEMYVQSGWLRASLRTLDDAATELRPTKTFAEEDASPLPEGVWELARVEMMAFGHPFRTGSRIRISIDTPGNSRAEWKFDLKDYPADTVVAVAHDADAPSSVVLPLLSGVAATGPIAPCPSLRGQPCRDASAIVNSPSSLP